LVFVDHPNFIPLKGRILVAVNFKNYLGPLGHDLDDSALLAHIAA
jgi:hypothetical protein